VIGSDHDLVGGFCVGKDLIIGRAPRRSTVLDVAHMARVVAQLTESSCHVRRNHLVEEQPNSWSSATDRGDTSGGLFEFQGSVDLAEVKPKVSR